MDVLVNIPPALLSLDAICVEFPGVLACDRVNLALRAGEIHALVGENGAGKSTLMHCAAGVVRPTSGTIRVGGAAVRFASPQDAQAAGIAMVFQNFLLVERLSVLDNVILGSRGLPPVLARKRLASAIEPVCTRLGIELDWTRPVESLSAGEKQKVALVRALYREAKILILDEPTAVLTSDESDKLLETMRRLAADGVAILFVSHKLPEIRSVADSITVMHRGRAVAESMPARDISAEEVARLMVGLRAETAARDKREASLPAWSGLGAGPAAGDKREASLPAWSGLGAGAAPLLRLDSVTLRVDGHDRLSQVSLSLRPGEILGIAGVSGNGQKELVSVCAGVMRPTSGTVSVRSRDLTRRSPRDFFEAGLCYVSEDRYGEASAPQLNLADCACLKGYRTLRGPLPGTIDLAAMSGFAERILDTFHVRHSGAWAPTTSLSGGNLQKLILGRELSHDPAVLVVHQPTQGLDLASTEFVCEEIRRQAATGTAVLLVSSDLDEVLRLSHRLLVIYRGRFVGGFEREQIDRARVGALMAGLTAGTPGTGPDEKGAQRSRAGASDLPPEPSVSPRPRNGGAS
ncbi:MAG: ABC transporter ATP-binding protein [Deltaproteobacteria bacterium]|nr:ABC transporter ATP-binding protein [Deltaproteobacteria bacterium]